MVSQLYIDMSGHSKWSTIKRQKGLNDARRGQIFSKLARAVTLAARQGGGDPGANLKLRLLIEKARESNMPKENIERALRQAQGKLEGELQEVIYEGYGVGGVALLVEAATDNKNRTTQEIKNIFDKGGGSLSTPGSVAFQFEQKGLILVGKDDDQDKTILLLIDLGAEDVEEVEDGIEIYTKPAQLFAIREKIEQNGLNLKSAELVYKAKNKILSLNEQQVERNIRLIDTLDEQDDVQKVYSNLE